VWIQLHYFLARIFYLFILNSLSNNINIYTSIEHKQKCQAMHQAREGLPLAALVAEQPSAENRQKKQAESEYDIIS
jgi:hypothetical protein